MTPEGPLNSGWVRFYRLLLHLYPSKSRTEFGEELIELFSDLIEASREEGFGATIAVAVQTYLDAPLSAIEARREIRRRKERLLSGTWRPRYGENLLADLAYAFRSLKEHPTFAVASILTLGIGIGSNTAVYSVVSSVVLEPLPYEQPDELVMLWSVSPNQHARSGFSAPAIPEVRQRSTVFEAIGAGWSTETNLETSRGPTQINMTWTTVNFFDLLGVTPILGRHFRDEDRAWFDPEALDDPGFRPASAPAIVDHSLWIEMFGASNDVVGQEIVLNGQTMEIIGVAPPDFEMLLPEEAIVPRKTDVWAVFPVDPSRLTRDDHNYTAIGRLREGVSLEEAQADIDGIAEWQRQTFSHESEANLHLKATWLHDEVVGKVRPTLLLLMGSVTFVLLIACANVAQLALARAATRRKEFAIRATVGGGPSRLIRQVLTESALISAAGLVVGLSLAYWGIDLLLLLRPHDLPRLDTVSIDGRVLGVSTGLAIAATMLFGIAPAITSSRTEAGVTLHETANVTPVQSGFRKILIIVEVAISLILLIGSGLMMRTFSELRSIEIGFNPSGLYTARVAVPFFGYLEETDRVSFFDDLTTALGTLPEFQGIGAAVSTPFDNSADVFRLGVFGDVDKSTGDGNAMVQAVLPGYLSTIEAWLREGRFFEHSDLPLGTPTTVLSESLAQALWPGENATGKTAYIGPVDADVSQLIAAEVIGVVGDIRYSELTGTVDNSFYVPFSMRTWNEMTITASTTQSLSTINAVLRREVNRIDPEVAVSEFRPMRDDVDAALAPTRFTLTAIGVFAAIAVVLATIGLYGVISYASSRRTREIGVRLAFGAERGAIVRLVVGQGMVLTGIGIIVGLGVLFLMTGAMQTVLYGVSPNDPTTYVTLTALLIAVSLIATYIPARRASMTDPCEALRKE